MAEVFANSEDPDQMPRSVVSDLGLHFLPVTGTFGSPDYNGLNTSTGSGTGFLTNHRISMARSPKI